MMITMMINDGTKLRHCHPMHYILKLSLRLQAEVQRRWRLPSV